MKQNTLIGSLAAVAILIGLIGYAASRPTPASAPDAPATANAIPEMSPYAEHGTYYDIAANYPTTTPLRASADSAARASMRAFIAGQIDQFKKDGNFDHLTAEDIKMMGYNQGRKQTLDIKYLISSSPRTVSYIYTIYLDTLGAHPNGFFKTFTFDTQTGKELSLADIFAPGADYLTTLSSLSSVALTKNMQDLASPEMIAAGTKPETKNFENFFFDNADFVLLFSPYQVAAYAAGPQTVRIPLSNLSSVLNPEYRQ